MGMGDFFIFFLVLDGQTNLSDVVRMCFATIRQTGLIHQYYNDENLGKCVSFYIYLHLHEHHNDFPYLFVTLIFIHNLTEY